MRLIKCSAQIPLTTPPISVHADPGLCCGALHTAHRLSTQPQGHWPQDRLGQQCVVPLTALRASASPLQKRSAIAPACRSNPGVGGDALFRGCSIGHADQQHNAHGGCGC